MLLHQIVSEYVPAIHHRRRRGVLAGVSPPHKNLVHGYALTGGLCDSFIGLNLVVEKRAISVVAIYGNQDVALGVHNPVAASVAAEAAQDL